MMKVMKKTVAILSVAAMAVGMMAGCGSAKREEKID